MVYEMHGMIYMESPWLSMASGVLAKASMAEAYW